MKKKEIENNIFLLMCSLRQTHHNTDSERKINKKVFLYIIYSFLPALKQKSLFPIEASLSKISIILSREARGLKRTNHHYRPQQRRTSWVHASSSTLSNSSTPNIFFFSSCLPVLLPGEGMHRDACFIAGKIRDRAAEMVWFSSEISKSFRSEPEP